MHTHRLASLLVSCALVGAPALAAAQVTEPNGMRVPIDSSAGGETQLYTLFSSRGETIDWQADAHTRPDVFSPLCGFTATFVMNQAGSHFGLAWYNATGSAPTPSDLHLILPAGAAVGTMITSADIRTSPAYAGGLIGFALVGGETHYSESRWDTVCSSCSPAAPWITALIYQSTATPNAYYLAFEDGSTSASGWNNDGDFNDDVFFITGVTCSGGGAACDTGMMGVCAAGVMQCTSGGTLACTPITSSSGETCNGLDDDCNGSTDDGATCPMAGFVCDHGTCVHACGSAEFGCTGGLVCNADGFCVDPRCASVTCPAGTVCVAGACRAPCDGVTCPHGTVCRLDRCVDPCAGVMCSGGQVCDAGVCTESCTCAPCAAGLACDAVSGRCGDPACASSTCGAGTHCEAGTCVDDCMGATCPPGQMCTAGACVPDPCAAITCTGGMVCRMGTCVDPCMGVTCTGGQICVGGTCMTDACAGVSCPPGSHCVSGSCFADGTDGGGSDAGGAIDGGRGRGPVTSGGCCAVFGRRTVSGGSAGSALVLLGIAFALVVRRRR